MNAIAERVFGTRNVCENPRLSETKASGAHAAGK